jgi:cardiolipin synthase A/B
MKRAFALAFVLLAAACSSSNGSTENPSPDPAATEQPPGVEPQPPGQQQPPAKVEPACEPLVPRTKPLTLAVLPDAGVAPFVSVIEKATKSIRVMVYQMGYGPILDALVAKAKAGVKTRVILDLAQKDVNQKYMDQLLAAGAEVIWSDPSFTFMHAKVILVDDAEAVISTGNYYIKNMLSERNFAINDTDPADVSVLVKLFDADFTRTPPDLSCTRLLVSPVNARQRLLDYIASAKKTIYIESMQMGDRDVRDALAERKAAGVDVRLVLADPSWIDANADAAAFLKSKGIESRWIKHMHAKAIVVDGKTAYAGSINISWTSLTKNREVGLIVTEQSNVDAMTATFEKDWAAATPM